MNSNNIRDLLLTVIAFGIYMIGLLLLTGELTVKVQLLNPNISQQSTYTPVSSSVTDVNIAAIGGRQLYSDTLKVRGN